MSRPFYFAPMLALTLALAARADVDRHVQVEGRGPLHEAYAQPWEKNPRLNEAVAQQPPEAVSEEPPDDRPPGDKVQWIPGYWQWDDDKKDFLWVSGFWRDAPGDRRWVQGFWANTDKGWRWVSGHWAADPEKDYQYVPNPPDNGDQGPQTRPPDADSFYIPGTWFYTENGYNYRDGYWADVRPGYTWVPAQYIWTPNGCIFASGFWDRAIGARGLLFAPVYFGARAAFGAGYVYRPAVALAFGAVANSLFVRSSFGHYYFGDYYGRSYGGLGFQPWVGFAARNYDPHFAYERWANRNNAQWQSGLHATYTGRANGTLPVPPRTFADQARSTAGGKTPATMTTLDQLRQSGQRLVPVTAAQRASQMQTVQQIVQRSADMTRSTMSRPSTGANGRAATSASATNGPGRPPIQGLGGGGGIGSSIIQGLTQPRSGGGPTTSFKPAPSASGPNQPPSAGAATQRPIMNGVIQSLQSGGAASGGLRPGNVPSVGGRPGGMQSGGGRPGGMQSGGGRPGGMQSGGGRPGGGGPRR